MKRRIVFVILALVLTSIIIMIPVLRKARGGVFNIFGGNQVAIARINPDPFNPMAILDTGERPAVAEDPQQNCTYTDYYWIENTEHWPSTIVINDQRYTREEGLELISKNSGEISERLLRSLFVAYLNIYKGADMSQIVDTVRDSETWLAGTPDDALLSNFRRQMGVTLAANLDAYNNGLLGPGLCPDQPETPVPTSIPTIPSTVSPTNTNQLRMFFENLFSGKDQTLTPTLAPTLTETNTPPPPANNQAPPPQDNPPPQATNTQPPPPTDTQLPPTNTEPPPPTETVPPPPTNTQPPPPPEDDGSGQIIIGNNENQTINCGGAEVIVEGNNNTLSLLGICSGLTVNGNHNQISLATPTSITDNGNNNNIVIQ